LSLPLAVAFFILAVTRIDVGASDQPRGATTFTDRNGQMLGTVLSADREHAAFVPLDRVSPAFVSAILAVEDARFYSHAGVDPLASIRALTQLMRNGQVVSGASTITMQDARLLFGASSTAKGKLREVWLAFRMEAGSSKSAILQAYVNRLPMGGNVYGVEAAAQTYFGSSAADLDLAQAALLAAIPNDPVRLDPRTHWGDLKQRQRYVLARMQRTGAIDATLANRAFAEQVHLAPQTRGILAGAHLLFSISSQRVHIGPVVQTTLDRPLQAFVETQLRALLATLAARNVHQGAALVIDNRSGDVLAYVGSADYFDDANAGRNDGVRALRQPGSALKPFLYQLAFETGTLAPNAILADVPSTYAIPGGQLYSPSDYSNAFAGPVRVRLALANSLNIPAVRVLSLLGTQRFLERLQELGFEHLRKPASYYGLGLTLGGGEVSLWELTRAYVTLARGGSAIPLRTVIARGVPQSRSIGKSGPWSLVTDILADSHARARSFGVNSILDLPFATAVKTGTSSDFRDTWTVGYSRAYTVGVWVGNFNGQPMRHVSGVSGAAPLWNRVMLRLHESHDPGSFESPAGFVRRPICAATGWRPLPGCSAVVSEYLSASELADYGRARTAHYNRSYDEWLAAQNLPAKDSSDVHILFPHQHDTFVLNPVDDAVQVAPVQAIQFHVRTPQHARVIWQLNGRVLAQTSGNTLMWALRPGTWRLGVKTGSRLDFVSFQVVRAQTRSRRGFSL
ncbi:MAG: penicillin-binding protein 1C, partial [Candidatus Eremiobacteraeota bacterium]|nr:penicillin-binding protein 1C [Candidatus Eremiobacteraeota bacterium]